MRKKLTFLTACSLAIFSGSVGKFAFSPFDHAFLIFFSAIGLIYLASRKSSPLMAVWLWGLFYFSIGLDWVQVSMTQFGGVPDLLGHLAVWVLGAYLALYPLLFGFLIRRFNLNSPWLWASVFTLCEYLRGVVFTGFPWLQFGYSLIDTPFAGLAPILGVQGLTFWVILVSGYAVQIGDQIARKTLAIRPLVACFAALLVAFVSQSFTWSEKDPQKAPLTVSLVQGNIEQKMKWDPNYFNTTVETYHRLITPLLGQSDLIILPESAIPAPEWQIAPLLDELQQQGLAKGSELIIGTLYQAEQGIYNSAVVLANPQQPYHPNSAQRYNKHHLVPFGEYVPFGHLLDVLREVFILPINLSQGAFIQPPLQAKNHRFNLAICYEIIFGEQLQANQKASNADYLLTISNDAWFGASAGPWQHFQIARMRSLELGKPLIRATNTGVTAFIDERGKIVKQAPQFEATVLTAKIQSSQSHTPFSQFGVWLIYAVSLFSIALGGFLSFHHRRTNH